MRKSSAAIALILVHCLCSAGEVRQYDRNSPKSDDRFIVGVECNKVSKQLQVGFFDAHNLPGKRMDLWDTFDLKKNNANGDAVEKVLSVERRCNLGSHRYQLRITGAPANWNLNGTCGSLTYAKAKVWKDGALIFNDDISSCQDARVLKLITFFPDTDRPARKHGENLSELLH
jgi:hypothetical protein